ncbi:MAG TPA: AbrB/MazE/SpoVT family DNA-binding domain-containing protein [Nitrospira sp.]|nr:AbrB/MazE/SpoVT family DNA-binding domain-containing protein [Nitrospira sp.]
MALVKIWGKGQLTIPASIRRELNLREETPVTLVKVGNVILMTPKVLQVDTASKTAKKEMKKAGLTVEEIMADLDRQRKRYNKERYGT